MEVAEVTKQYEKVKAVDGLSFDVNRGEVFALLGPNGAGKTTMVRMLIGIIYADTGKIKFSLDNHVPQQKLYWGTWFLAVLN